MKKQFAAAALLVLLIPAVSLSAFDQMWGIRTNLGFDFPEVHASSAGVVTTASAGAWYKGSWSQAANMEIDAGVGLDGSFDFGVDTGINVSFLGYSYTLYPILDKLNFYGNSGIYGYKAGRQIVSDPSGLIIDAPFDGVDFAVNLGRSYLRAGVGYTGLTFGDSAEFYLTATDTGRDSLLSTPRLIEYVQWSLPALTESVNLSAYLLALQDFTGEDQLAENGNEQFHPVYLELTADGSLAGSFIYEAAFVGQFGVYGDASVTAGLGLLGFSWIPGNANRLGVEVIASTGDGWDRGGYTLGNASGSSLYQYLPVSIVLTRGYVIEFEPGNITSVAVFYARRPKLTHSWELRSTTFLRNIDGPVSSSLVSQTSGSGTFLAQELLMSWFWRPKSDFGWDLKLGVVYAGDPIEMDSLLQEYWFDKVPMLFRLGFDWSWSF